MLKNIFVTAVLALSSFAALAAVEVNKGSAAELDALPGVGPAMSQRILDARKQSEFKDWSDFMARVKGVKEKSAAKLSGAGLTVNGKPYTATGTAVTAAAKPTPPAKTAATPAPAATPATASPKK